MYNIHARINTNIHKYIHTYILTYKHGRRFRCKCAWYIVPHKVGNVANTFGHFVLYIIM